MGWNGWDINPKHGPKAIGLAILNLEQVANLSLFQGTPYSRYLSEDFEDIANTTDFTCARHL